MVNLKKAMAAAAIAGAFGFTTVGLGAGGVASAVPNSSVTPGIPLPQKPDWDGPDWDGPDYVKGPDFKVKDKGKDWKVKGPGIGSWLDTLPILPNLPAL